MEGIYGNVSQRPVGGEHVRQEECHYVFSGLCLSVSVSWNFYSVVNNGSISFPPPFRLPAIPARQEIGFAPPLGTLYGFALLTDGIFLQQPVKSSVEINPVIVPP